MSIMVGDKEIDKERREKVSRCKMCGRPLLHGREEICLVCDIELSNKIQEEIDDYRG